VTQHAAIPAGSDSYRGVPVMLSVCATLLPLCTLALCATALQTHGPICIKKQLAALLFASQALLAPALAFENAVPNSYTMPKSRGPMPTNLGLGKDGRLRSCLRPSPNCFSTTPEGRLRGDGVVDDDEDVVDGGGREEVNIWGVDHTIKMWESDKTAPDETFDMIIAAVERYEPGQGGIDGGGWKIIKTDKAQRYLYVQYESLRRGYIDDVEFAVNKDARTVQVVSSSRLGYLDFQVNAKRLNYLRSLLLKSGFRIEEITPDTHPVYFEANR